MSKPPHKPRQRAVPLHKSFRITKKRFSHPTVLPSSVSLFRSTLSLVRANKRLFGGIVLIQSLFTIVFIQGFSGSTEISDLKQELQDLLGGAASPSDKVGTGLALFGYLASSTSNSSGDIAGAYQFSLAVITSLAVIWAVRQLLVDETPTVKEVFYKGMYPLIPFLLVLLVIGLQLLPALIGNLLYTTVISNGLAVTALEKILWLLIFVSLALLSLYMVVSSLFALYIVTLPDMTPMKALRSARQLVLHRRFSVALRVVSLPIVLFCISVLIFVPLLVILTPLAQPLFLVFTSLGFVVTHTYMYHLYRSLL